MIWEDRGCRGVGSIFWRPRSIARNVFYNVFGIEFQSYATNSWKNYLSSEKPFLLLWASKKLSPIPMNSCVMSDPLIPFKAHFSNITIEPHIQLKAQFVRIDQSSGPLTVLITDFYFLFNTLFNSFSNLISNCVFKCFEVSPPFKKQVHRIRLWIIASNVWLAFVFGGEQHFEVMSGLLSIYHVFLRTDS